MLRRTDLGHWVIEGDDYGVSGLVCKANSFAYPENVEVLKRVAPYIPEGGVVVDAGASLGDQTVMYAQMVGADGHVYAFEPHAESYEALARNTAYMSNVCALPYALSSGEQENATFTMVPANFGASFLGTDGRYPGFPTTIVTVTTLDDELHWIDRLDFIHLDAEGMEVEILKGAAKLIETYRPDMLIEVTPVWLARYGYTQQDLYDLLARFGYQSPIPMQDNQHWFDVLVRPLERTVTVS